MCWVPSSCLFVWRQLLVQDIQSVVDLLLLLAKKVPDDHPEPKVFDVVCAVGERWQVTKERREKERGKHTHTVSVRVSVPKDLAMCCKVRLCCLLNERKSQAQQSR